MTLAFDEIPATSLWHHNHIYKSLSEFPTMREISKRVMQFYDLSEEEFFSKSRAYYISHPRQEFMWMARQVKYSTGKQRFSRPAIAKFLGMEDHTSIIYGERKHAERLGDGSVKSMWTAEEAVLPVDMF